MYGQSQLLSQQAVPSISVFREVLQQITRMRRLVSLRLVAEVEEAVEGAAL